MKKRIYSASATERPIIFSGQMVRAILAGEKTQTRRMPKNEKKPFTHGLPGDRLWVRETWREASIDGDYDYKATSTETQSVRRWKSAMYMPQKATRIILEITGVRGEHLHDITEADAIAEGAQFWAQEQGQDYDDARLAFCALWDQVNASRIGAGWDRNPYVSVLTFRRVFIDKTEQQSLWEAK